MTVYVVTQGEYSHYCIKGVFSTKEKAQEFVSKNGGDTVEEYEMDQWKGIEGTYQVCFSLLTGEILSEKPHAIAALDEDAEEEAMYPWRNDAIAVRVCTLDRERAVKVAREKFTRLRVFWDKARVRAASVLKPNEYETHMRLLVFRVASVLAGFDQIPTDDSGYAVWTRAALKAKL